MNPLRSHELLSRRSSRLLVVDVQEKLAAAMPPETQRRLFAACHFLCQAAKILQVPVTLTEQYPQGLGPTVPLLTDFAETRIAKKRFSALDCTGWPGAAEVTDDRFQIIVAGMESHVCVQQTVLDLLAAGYQTYVAVDAIAARGQIDHEVAVQRMANSGAIVTTTESVIFEWCETAEAAEFKQISALVKSRGL